MEPPMAIRIELVAWHSARPLKPVEVEERLAILEGFYPHLDHRRLCKIGPSGHTGLVVWLPKVEGLADLAGFDGEALAYASHLPFGISRHVDIAGSCTPAHVHALCEKVRSAPETMLSLGTPLNLVHMAADGGLHLHNDIRGFAEVFCHKGKSIQVWASRLSMPLLVALQPPVESVVAGQLRSVFSYYPFEHTPFRNVQRLEGCSSVFAGDWPAEPLCTRRNLLLESLGRSFARQGEPVDYAACREAVAGNLAEIARFWSGDLRCGLTGGRDSRAVLAFLIAGGLAGKVPLTTIKILKQDYGVAEQLVALCRRQGVKVDWQLVERPRSSYSAKNRDQAWDVFPAARETGRDVRAVAGQWLDWARGRQSPTESGAYVYHENPLLDRMVFQFHRLDGQTMPIGYYTTPARDIAQPGTPLTFGGQSGEILRASQYEAAHLADGPAQRQRKVERARFRMSKAWAGYPDPVKPYQRETHSRARTAFRRYFEEAGAGGVGSFLGFDYMNLIGKQSHRVDVPKQLLLSCPLSHPLLVIESYKLTAEQRVANTFHQSLIGELAPFLLEAPFSHQLPLETKDVRLDMTGKPQFWDANAVPGFAEIIREPERWNDTFEESSIAVELGARASPVLNAYQRDTVGGLLLWRAAHKAYGKVLAQYIERHRKSRGAAAAA